MALVVLPIADATLLVDADFVPHREREALFEALRAEIPWETHVVRIFGREIPSPRLSCWIGDPDATYVYSGTRFEPRPWTPRLAALRARVAAATGATYNSVLANLYRDGRDGMGFHADDEPELGDAPVIASLSLGATRRFVLKRKRGTGRHALELGDGTLLVMRDQTQRHWNHALPKTASRVGPRINLTFRHVDPACALRRRR